MLITFELKLTIHLENNNDKLEKIKDTVDNIGGIDYDGNIILYSAEHDSDFYQAKPISVTENMTFNKMKKKHKNKEKVGNLTSDI